MTINQLLLVFLATVPLSATFRLGHTGFEFKEIAHNKDKFESIFNRFSNTFKKFYFHKGESEERKRIFQENLERMDKLFSRYKNFKVDVNRFTDMTYEEFQKTYLMQFDVKNDFKEFEKRHPESCRRFKELREMKHSQFPTPHNHGHDKHDDDFEHVKDFKHFNGKGKNIFQREFKNRSFKGTDIKVGSSGSRMLQSQSDAQRVSRLKQRVDWTHYASPIQDQMRCSSCYAFSAIGTFEMMWAIKRGRVVNLSEQEIVDCSTENQGCIGGNPFRVFDYINRRGIANDSDYPYTGKKSSCRRISSTIKVRTSFDYYFLDNNVLELLEAIEEGPVAVVLHANEAFKHYSSGIFDDKNCRGQLNHSLTAVGFDLTHSIPYILLKNGWASDWGENGYMRISIGPLSSSNRGVCQMCDHDINVAPYI
jgi:C1A family cysteine protease